MTIEVQIINKEKIGGRRLRVREVYHPNPDLPSRSGAIAIIEPGEARTFHAHDGKSIHITEDPNA